MWRRDAETESECLLVGLHFGAGVTGFGVDAFLRSPRHCASRATLASARATEPPSSALSAHWARAVSKEARAWLMTTMR